MYTVNRIGEQWWNLYMPLTGVSLLLRRQVSIGFSRAATFYLPAGTEVQKPITIRLIVCLERLLVGNQKEVRKFVAHEAIHVPSKAPTVHYFLHCPGS